MSGLATEMRDLGLASYPEIFDRFKTLSEKYGGLSSTALVSAFSRANGINHDKKNPYIQNRRVKAISSLPENYTKDQVGDMLREPDSNEKSLRQVAHGLEYTAYPLQHIRRTYQDLLTYHSYIIPDLPDKGAEKDDSFWREWRLLERLRKEMDVGTMAHQIVGQVIQEGKVFYHPRVSVDKSHGKINYAFLQQLPSDWTKIAGMNNRSKYTVAFNLFYFMQPGTDPAQFGDLFTPYLDVFNGVVSKGPVDTNRSRNRAVYSSTSKMAVNFQKFAKFEREQNYSLAGNPEVYSQNGRWFYWVTLPADDVFTFEIDDTSRNAIGPFTGLFLSLIQLAQYEQVQLELVQNPLVSVLTGEIPYRDERLASSSDPYQLSNAGRTFFETLWYDMLFENNTSGIGFFSAPLNNMKLHTLAEAPSATKLSSTGYEYALSKSGLAGIIPSSSDTRAGMAQISMQIESKFGKQVYRTFNRMMHVIFDNLNLRHPWAFEMFGDLSTDKDMESQLEKDMTLGILPSTVKYLALHDLCLLDDIAISSAVKKSGILDLRQPLVSSFSAKAEDMKGSGNGSQNGAQDGTETSTQVKHDLNPGGRPKSEGVTSDGNEGDMDSPPTK